MLELKNIYFKRDNKTILNDINLKIEDNKCIIITGPNGSGKSTLAKIIIGIEKPDSGKIIYDSKDITNLSLDERAKLGISFAFQQPIKFKGITVEKLLNLASKNSLNKKEINELLLKVGLDPKEYLNREVNDKLSGGELKRIELASVIAKDSKLIIYDEPEAGIDLWSFNSLINLFLDNKLNKKETAIIISHQQRLFKIADQIILLEKGTIKSMDSICCPNKNCCLENIYE